MSDNSTTNVGDLEPIVLLLNKFNRKDLAEDILQEFAKRSGNYNQYDNIAKCFFKLKNYDLAIKYTEKTLVCADNGLELYMARANLINVYNHANYPEKALQYIRHCEIIKPDDIDIRLEKAYSYFLLNQKDLAEQILTETLLTANLSEEYITKIKFNLGTYYLYRDEFQKGLKLFLEEGAKLAFWNTETIFSRNNINLNFNNFEQKVKNRFIKWDGVPRPGKPLIVHAEAGIGDEIINFRFMDQIKKTGMIPYWFNSYLERKKLLEVFSRHGHNTIQDLSMFKQADEVYYVQSMHLPIVMNLEYKDLWHGPYIKADPKYVEKWNWVKKNKLSVGIRWQGNPAYDQDLHRSYPLKKVLDIFDSKKDYQLFSLQKDNGLEELDSRIHDLSDQLETWEDTLGCIENLDIVITSCTSVAHASAAMGKKTIVLIPISAYYVWSHIGDKSPWYGDNVILLRQQKPRSWEEPIEKLKNLL